MYKPLGTAINLRPDYISLIHTSISLHLSINLFLLLLQYYHVSVRLLKEKKEMFLIPHKKVYQLKTVLKSVLVLQGKQLQVLSMNCPLFFQFSPYISIERQQQEKHWRLFIYVCKDTYCDFCIAGKENQFVNNMYHCLRYFLSTNSHCSHPAHPSGNASISAFRKWNRREITIVFIRLKQLPCQNS